MASRYAVRSVIFDKDMNTAILSVHDGKCYKIPGGGIEESETEMEALHREMKEEAGCEVEVIDKIGEHTFTPEGKDRPHRSVCYVSWLKGVKGQPEFDADELERNYKLVWMNVDEAIKLMISANAKGIHENIIHNRDLNFLIKAKKYMDKNF